MNKEQYTKEFEEFWEKLDSGLSDEDGMRIAKEYYLFLLKYFEAGIIDNKEFAYSVAGTMKFDWAFENSTYNELTALAAELELPDEYIAGEKNKEMKKLIWLIKSL